jgi:hypothetical protein
VYVERRHTVTRGAPLDSHGKRAAFALFYAPLHFLVTHHVVGALHRDAAPPSAVVDIGCGTGAAGAAWALAAGGVPVVGIDRHPWAVAETRWTYQQLGLSGQVRWGDVTRLPRLQPGNGVIAAYVLNELSEPVRKRVEETLIAAAHRGVSVLVLEPIARALTPWWDQTARRVEAAGGRADEWRFPVELPPMLRLFDKAAGLNHQVLIARSLYCPGR